MSNLATTRRLGHHGFAEELSSGWVSLLDADLAEALTEQERWEAGRLRLRLLACGRGPVGLPALADPGIGYLVVSGLLTRQVGMGRVSAAEVLGAGDVLTRRPPAVEAVVDLASQPVLEALGDTKLAVIDGRSAAVVAGWPAVVAALAARTERRLERLSLLHAASHHLRIEDRILAALHLLCSEWGRVTPMGIMLPYRLTHEQLARVVVARRPSVTTALRALQREGHVLQRRDRCLVLRSAPVAVAIPA